MEGVYYTLFLLCSLNSTELIDDENDIHKQATFSNKIKENEALILNGNLEFFNPYGYLSGDDVYNIDVSYKSFIL
jgi:hypothetical protein